MKPLLITFACLAALAAWFGMSIAEDLATFDPVQGVINLVQSGDHPGPKFVKAK